MDVGGRRSGRLPGAGVVCLPGVRAGAARIGQRWLWRCAVLTAARRARLDVELRALPSARLRMVYPRTPAELPAGLPERVRLAVRTAASGRVAEAHRAEHGDALAVARGAGPVAWRQALVLVAHAYPAEYRAAVVAERARRAGGSP